MSSMNMAVPHPGSARAVNKAKAVMEFRFTRCSFLDGDDRHGVAGANAEQRADGGWNRVG
jgi:hypothetical protein